MGTRFCTASRNSRLDDGAERVLQRRSIAGQCRLIVSPSGHIVRSANCPVELAGCHCQSERVITPCGHMGRVVGGGNAKSRPCLVLEESLGYLCMRVSAQNPSPKGESGSAAWPYPADVPRRDTSKHRPNHVVSIAFWAACSIRCSRTSMRSISFRFVAISSARKPIMMTTALRIRQRAAKMSDWTWPPPSPTA